MIVSLTPQRRTNRTSGRVGLVVAIVLLAVVFFFAWRGSRGDAGTGGMTLEERYQADARIAPLLGDCGFGAPFEADTTDMAEILASKLDAGAQLEPQRRAKAELAAMDERAAEPLMRLFQSAAKDRWRGGVAKNVLTVCALAEGDWVVPIAVEALRSPREDLRGDATVVIDKHPSPELYDAVEDALFGFQNSVNAERALNAMNSCDARRFAQWFPTLLETAQRVNGYIESPVVDAAVPLLATLDDAEMARALKEVADNDDGLLFRHRPYLIAPMARQGDAGARQELMDLLAHEQRMPRHHACEALASAGLVDDTYVLAVTALDPAERSQTLERILDPKYDAARSEQRLAEIRDWARKALLDDEAVVRETALRGLLRRGDEEGRAFLMTLLAGSIDDRAMAMRSMRGTLDDESDAADQARTILQARWDQELAGSRQGPELTNILQTLGAVPGRATGEALLAAGDLAGANPIRGISGFRWCVGQAFNAGPTARIAIRERLAVETDPVKRLDLISFVWQDFELESVDLLLGIVEDEALSPYERLFAADRTVRMGHSEYVVPRLKRVYRGSSDAVLRPGLHCLLWVWFGPPMS